MTSAGTFWRTVRHLRPAQVLGRVRYRLARPRPNLAAAPALALQFGPWAAPAARGPSQITATRFRFLNQELDLAECGWDNPAVAKLWRYNLHYFDDLNAQQAVERRAWHQTFLQRWFQENPPAQGTGWEPYPASLRIVNWIKWFMGGAQAQPHWLHSLAVQARWLTGRLEWHLQGNHLFINAKALVFAGLYFEGDEADRWLLKGLAILASQLPEQVLADGGQFERSPMYHALALEDMLDLLNLGQALAPPGSPAAQQLAAWRETASRMLFWLRCMSHPDGGIGRFNDGADGIAPPNAALERYAAALGVIAEQPAADGVTTLHPSGYVRVARGPALALLDTAPLGPDYLLGHAHADTLSFELSLHGQRVVVNGGTSCYGVSPQRLAERGTAAHSTVQLAGDDSSEVWSGFRVGRRARPGPLKVDRWRVECSHDGYRHLAGAPVHRRRWQFENDAMTVHDSIEPLAAAGMHAAVARYHLAPGLRLQPMATNTWNVMQDEQCLTQVQVLQGQGVVAPSRHAPRFGVVLSTHCLQVELFGGQACTVWRWNADAHSFPDR